MNRAVSILQCPPGSFPLKYLGIPLKPTSLSHADWMPLIDKVENRLASWKGRCLSRGGRLILVNSVLSALPLHFLSFYILPSWVLKRIDRIRRSFLWTGEQATKGGTSLVKWDIVCTPRVTGGLGVLDLHTFNIALIAKWWWRIQHEPQRQWAQLVLFSYYENRRILKPQTEPPSTCSPFWKGVLKSATTFRLGARNICANGEMTLFWSDLWIGDQPLELAFPSLYEIATDKNGTVASQRDNTTWNLAFRQLLSPTRCVALGTLMGLLMSHQWKRGVDSLTWTLTEHGGFTVKSLYSKLKGGNIDTAAKTIWATMAPLKVKINLWLAYKGALLTSEVLTRRHIAEPFTCQLCNTENETSIHLFFTCPFVTVIWAKLCLDFNLPQIPPNLGALLTTWRRRRVSRNIEKEWDMKIAAVFSMIWKERNDRIFRRISKIRLIWLQ